MPVNSILTSSSGLNPDSSIRFLAKSTIFTGSPMSRTQIWPPSPITAACSTSWQASGMVMKKRRMSGCVTVTGPPAAIGTEHVTEPHGHVLGPPVLKCEQQQFGDALGGAHDVGGPHGLIGGDQNEVFDSVLAGCHRDVVCPEDVVLDRFEHVRLHQGDVLIGCGMIDHRWPEI